MSTCPNCGAESTGDSAFCTSCGAPLKTLAAAPGAAPVAPGTTQPPASAYAPVGQQGPVYVQHSTGSSGFADFVTFRRMVSPILIQIAFWVLEIGSLVLHIGIIVGASSEGSPGWIPLVMIFSLLVWALLIRVWLESFMVFFMINSNIVRIRRRLGD